MYAVGVGGASECSNLFVSAGTYNAVKQNLLAQKTEVFPNPATNTIHVTISSKQNKNISVALIDNYGNRIAIKNINATINTNTFFDVSHVAAGTYWLRINDGSETAVQKVIVQH